MSNFYETLQDVLNFCNYTIKDISTITGVSQRTLRDLKNFNPSLTTALKIVDGLNSSLDFFERKIEDFKCKFNKNYTINFADNLSKLLNEQNISYYKLTKQIGVSENTISRLKQSKNLPSYSTLVDVANFLDCSIDELVGRKYTTNKDLK